MTDDLILCDDPTERRTATWEFNAELSRSLLALADLLEAEADNLSYPLYWRKARQVAARECRAAAARRA